MRAASPAQRRRAVALALVCALPLLLAAPAGAETARIRSRDRWVLQEAHTLAELRSFTPAPAVPLDRFGGLRSVTLKASGFFRTEQADGRWWLVDPEGHPFLSVGLCTVRGEGLAPGVADGRFGGTAGWARTTAALLRDQGFTTLGAWSDHATLAGVEQRVPATPIVHFLNGYAKERPAGNGERGEPNGCLPVFDPEFESFADGRARQLAETKDDPWIIGYFSDNEIGFQPDALDRCLALPDSDLGRRAARDWLDRRPGERKHARDLTDRDRADFLEHVASRYYGVVAAAIRKYDPNHLYLGSRLHGRAIAEPVFRGSGAVDVVSVNYYHSWSPDAEQMRQWTEWSGRPFIASEWYARSVESGAEGGGSGFKVGGERDQGLFYQNFTLGLLEAPGCVGWHWFKYVADRGDSPHGIVDLQGAPRAVLLGMMRELNRQAYPLAIHFARGRWSVEEPAAPASAEPGAGK